jgi:hypothetical protein
MLLLDGLCIEITQVLDKEPVKGVMCCVKCCGPVSRVVTFTGQRTGL